MTKIYSIKDAYPVKKCSMVYGHFSSFHHGHIRYLNYAKQQEKVGNIKSTIATLERLSKLYPKNSDIKLYLLSILLKMDSKVKVDFMVKTMLNDPNTSDETKNLIAELLSDKKFEDKKKNEVDSIRRT